MSGWSSASGSKPPPDACQRRFTIEEHVCGENHAPRSSQPENYSNILKNVGLSRDDAGFAAGPVSQGGGTGTDFYYSDRFQVIEDRVLGEEVLEGSQYVWSERYIDAMVLRDRDANFDTEDGREERLYAQHDASFNTTAVIDTEGTVVERVVYDPYGARTFKADDWSSLGSFSTVNWVYLFQGGRQDPVSNLVHFRGRDYSTTLGRFVQPDPLGYPDGANRYQMEGSNPVNRLDPMGLKQVEIEGAITLENNFEKYGPDTAKVTILPHFFDPNGKQPEDVPFELKDDSIPSEDRKAYEDIAKGLLKRPTFPVLNSDGSPSILRLQIVDGELVGIAIKLTDDKIFRFKLDDNIEIVIGPNMWFGISWDDALTGLNYIGFTYPIDIERDGKLQPNITISYLVLLNSGKFVGSDIQALYPFSDAGIAQGRLAEMFKSQATRDSVRSGLQVVKQILKAIYAYAKPE